MTPAISRTIIKTTTNPASAPIALKYSRGRTRRAFPGISLLSTSEGIIPKLIRMLVENTKIKIGKSQRKETKSLYAIQSREEMKFGSM